MHSFSSVTLDWEKLCRSPIIVLRQIISTLFYVAYIQLSQPALGTVALSPQQRVSHTPAANVSDMEIPPRSCTQQRVRRKERSQEGKEQRKGEGGKAKEKRNLLQPWQKLLKSGNENKGNCLCQKLATDEHKAWSKIWWLTDPYVIRICRTQSALISSWDVCTVTGGRPVSGVPPLQPSIHTTGQQLSRGPSAHLFLLSLKTSPKCFSPENPTVRVLVFWGFRSNISYRYSFHIFLPYLSSQTIRFYYFL